MATTTALPKTIRSILQPDINSSHLIMSETPLPTPTHPHDHLIKVAAAAPCLGELWWAKNFPSIIPADREPVPCQDLAGTVVSAPPDSPFKPGDEVFGRIEANRPGSGREYTLARTGELALKPKSLNWVETAATPLSALTAYQALFVQGTLNPAALTGDVSARKQNSKIRVLVTAAGGGVGSWAVQFANLAGAGAIIGVCSASKSSTVLDFGATSTVDYKTQTLASWVSEDPATRECDLVFDCVGGETLAHCWSAVKEGGVLIAINTSPDSVKPEGLTKTEVKTIFFIVEPLGSQLAEIAALIDGGKGKLVPLIDSVLEFEEFQKAFDIVEGGHAKGKVVIKIGI